MSTGGGNGSDASSRMDECEENRPALSGCCPRGGDFGHIEFVGTTQRLAEIGGKLFCDAEHRLWMVWVQRAIRDMRATRCTMELIDEQVFRELV